MGCDDALRNRLFDKIDRDGNGVLEACDPPHGSVKPDTRSHSEIVPQMGCAYGVVAFDHTHTHTLTLRKHRDSLGHAAAVETTRGL